MGGALVTLFGTWRRRVRQRQTQRQTLDAPRITFTTDADAPTPRAEPPLRDWPEIDSRHPGWWQVARVEVRPDGGVRYALIAECRTEDQAFSVAVHQASQVRITKWGSKLAPYTSMRPPKRIEDD